MDKNSRLATEVVRPLLWRRAGMQVEGILHAAYKLSRSRDFRLLSRHAWARSQAVIDEGI